MLRASKLYGNGVIRTIANNNNKHIGSMLLKRGESTIATEEKKSGAFGKTLFGLTLVLGSVYGGAVYYATTDRAFHDTFTTYIPGGEKTLEFVEDYIKNNDIGKVREQASDWKKQAKQYANSAKSFGGKIQESTTDAIDYAQNTYQTLSGQKQVPTLDKIENKLAENTRVQIINSEKNEKTTLPPMTGTATTVHIGTSKETKPVIVATTIEKPEPIIVKSIVSDHAVVCRLSQIVTELTSILNEAGLSGLGRQVIAQAESNVEKINQQFLSIDAEQAAILKSLQQLKAKGDAIDGSLEKFHVQAQKSIEKAHVDTAATIIAREAQLKNQFEQTRAEMKTSFAQQLAADLNAQQERLQQARTEALVAQAQELQKRFVKEVKLLVEQERAGRLAKLDSVSQRFKALEKYALQNAASLDKSRQNHVIHVTLDALNDTLEAPKRQPFADELQALHHNTKDDKTIQTVLSVIPKDVAKDGIDSVGELSNRFEEISNEIRRIALVPEDGGFGSHIISIVMSYLMFKKNGLVQGDDVESVLARTEYYLKRDNLENATRELNQLSGWPKRLAQDWIQSARRHLEVKQALEVAETQAVLLSLLEV